MKWLGRIDVMTANIDAETHVCLSSPEPICGNIVAFVMDMGSPVKSLEVDGDDLVIECVGGTYVMTWEDSTGLCIRQEADKPVEVGGAK